MSSSDLIALLDVAPELDAPAEICPELFIVTLFAVPEFSVTVIVLVLLLIIPPDLFVIVELCAFNKFIALEPSAFIVPELVIINPDWSFPWTALEAVEVTVDPEFIVKVPLSCPFIFTGAAPLLDNVEESVIDKDVSSALYTCWVD